MPRESYYLPTRRLVSQNNAALVQAPDVPRSRFINRHGRITAFDAGKLVPFLVEEILPGDHMQYTVTAYVRMSTPLFPLFSNQRVDTFFFFVPMRLVWENTEKFFGEQADPDSSIDFTIPTLTGTVGGYDVGSIFDHFGLPTIGQVGAAQDVTHNVLPLRAYNLIFNTWFRDQNIVDSLTVTKGNSGDLVSHFALQQRAKSHDYFTSALPAPQKFTNPLVPIGGLAPIEGIGAAQAGITFDSNVDVFQTVGSAQYPKGTRTSNAAQLFVRVVDEGGGDHHPDIYANLADATGVSINTFREAFMVQSLLERDARGGTRYPEILWNHFRVRSPDARIQRPEYIGGGQSPLILTPVAQTAPTETEPLGALGAAGTSAGQHRASYAAVEHGYIIGLINVRSELAYQQGMRRLWRRTNRYSLYWPSLALLGEQEIPMSEIYCTGDPTNDDDIFGYQERWAEYRQNYNEITGIMRSTASGTLDAWHLAQEFSVAPTLSPGFIGDVPPMDRVLAAGELAANQQYLADIMIDRVAVRPLPTFSTPATLGRF